MTIALGIDLGTTNSSIATSRGGQAQTLANPRDMGRRTLPSVVAFRSDRTIVGSKARQRMEKDAENVIGVFKRKMGTSERFRVPAAGGEVTPIELSTLVLRELLTFAPPGIERSAAVITIPASFDTVQSKATEAAGLAAGFKQVSLLQEPIAASLAYANQAGAGVPETGKWLVYDLGGGTFDVALLSIADGEMKVADHAGDNFLGGTDFDQLIVEKIIVPRLRLEYAFTNLLEEMKSARGKYNAQFYILRQRAEELKIQLSTEQDVEVIIDGFTDDAGEAVDLEFILTREEFKELIRPAIEGAATLVEELLQRNGVLSEDLAFILLVGGSTYIPYVREVLESRFGARLNTEVDPTTCVGEGAAVYGATRPLRSASPTSPAPAAAPEQGKPGGEPKIKVAYPRVSKAEEETLVGKASGDLAGWTYRIARQDGGFDSGHKSLRERFFEDLPLATDTYNTFLLSLSGPDGQLVPYEEPIGINGGYAIRGQPLPEAITLEVDDPSAPSGTASLLVFEKNATLPLRRTLTRALNRGLQRDNPEDRVRINILEGPAAASPESNKKIGYLSVDGTRLSRNVSRGTDLEITLQMNENRDLSVAVYFTMTGQEFEQTFTPTERHTPLASLRYEYDRLRTRWEHDRQLASENDEFDLMSTMLYLEDDYERLGQRIGALTKHDATDERYQLEDLRRAIVRQLDAATGNRPFLAAIKDYEHEKLRTIELVENDGDEHDEKQLTYLRRREGPILSGNHLEQLKSLTKEMRTLYLLVFNKSPRGLANYLNELAFARIFMSDETRADELFRAGQQAVQQEDWPRLKQALLGLNQLLPAEFFTTGDTSVVNAFGTDGGKVGF